MAGTVKAILKLKHFSYLGFAKLNVFQLGPSDAACSAKGLQPQFDHILNNVCWLPLPHPPTTYSKQK